MYFRKSMSSSSPSGPAAAGFRSCRNSLPELSVTYRPNDRGPFLQIATRGHEPDQTLQAHPLKSHRQRKRGQNGAGDFRECDKADHDRLLYVRVLPARDLLRRAGPRGWVRGPLDV
jgi:hypothetical protein